MDTRHRRQRARFDSIITAAEEAKSLNPGEGVEDLLDSISDTLEAARKANTFDAEQARRERALKG